MRCLCLLIIAFLGEQEPPQLQERPEAVVPAGGSCPGHRLALEQDPHGEGAPLCASVLRQRATAALQVAPAW